MATIKNKPIYASRPDYQETLGILTYELTEFSKENPNCRIISSSHSICQDLNGFFNGSLLVLYKEVNPAIKDDSDGD